MTNLDSKNDSSKGRILLISLAFLTLFLTGGASSTELPKGASFKLMTDIGFIGSRFYLYSPSSPNLDFDMSRMLNSVVFIYPDKPHESKERAWQTLAKCGLIDIAEKEVAYIIMPLPVSGNSWTQADLRLYYESQYYLAGGDVYEYPSMQHNGSFLITSNM
jgi:hypothetical protein